MQLFILGNVISICEIIIRWLWSLQTFRTGTFDIIGRVNSFKLLCNILLIASGLLLALIDLYSFSIDCTCVDFPILFICKFLLRLFILQIIYSSRKCLQFGFNYVCDKITSWNSTCIGNVHLLLVSQQLTLFMTDLFYGRLVASTFANIYLQTVLKGPPFEK